MNPIDIPRKFREMLEEYLLEVFRRYEEALKPFCQALQDWTWELLSKPYPPDWREQWHAFIAEQHARGFRVPDRTVHWFEGELESMGRNCGCLPAEDGALGTQEQWRARAAIPPAHWGHQSPQRRAPTQIVQVAFPADASSRPAAPPTRTAAGPPRDSRARYVDGVEVAGPGPDVTASYKAKVQQALEVLDPSVARWWKAPSVEGKIRSRDATFFEFGHFSGVTGDGQPIITVDQDYTAGKTAQAIIAEIASGWFADSLGAFYRKYKFAQRADYQEFRQWQKGATKEAARLASVLAELYFSSIATLTPAGDLLVTLDDLSTSGPQWRQLLSVLPLVGAMPIGAVVMKLGKRKVKIGKSLARKLHLLSDEERSSLLQAIARAKSDDEASALVERELRRHVGNRQIHHPISKVVHDALEEHPLLKGKYKLRDSRFEALAIDYEAHHGLQEWHRQLDEEAAEWIRRNRKATPEVFERWLQSRYSKPDLKRRFPKGF